MLIFRTANLKSRRAALLSAGLLAIVLGSRTADAQFQFAPGVVALDSLLRSEGPRWQEARSSHFLLYTERGPRLPLAPTALLDSLEDAWKHASSFLGALPRDESPVTVLVTRSAARFPGVLAATSRGVMRPTTTGGEVIILVNNDSIRAFTRHEVMHVVARRVWGLPGAPWVDEGIATLADGRCQSTNVLAVARDVLRAEPTLTAANLSTRFAKGAGPFLGNRLRAYALAASMVAFVDDHDGRQALQSVWRNGVLPRDAQMGDTFTRAWRQYVERAAAGQHGLSTESLDSRGCG